MSFSKHLLLIALVFGLTGCRNEPATEPATAEEIAYMPPGIDNITEIDPDCEYASEGTVIEGVIKPYGGGRWKGLNESYIVKCFTFYAWRYEGKPVSLDEMLVLRPLPADYDPSIIFPDCSIHRVRVLKANDLNRAIFLNELPLESPDAKLTQIAEELKKPVILTSNRFGRLELDHYLDWFEGEATWDGETIDLHFHDVQRQGEVDERQLGEAALTHAEQIWSNESAWKKRIEDFAVKELLDLKNGSWLEDDEKPLTAEDFLSRIAVTSISISPKGDFEFWFYDGGIFWDHSIVVYGNVNDGPTSANIEG